MIQCNGMRMASLGLLLDKVGLTAREWSKRLNAASVPLMMLWARSECYFEVEAVGRVLSGSSSGQAWLSFISRNGLRRKLTKAEKIKVAASQKWRCLRCEKLLDECFEVDHVEQHALRGNDSSSNLQALCPHCHRKKSSDDLYLSNPYFGVEALNNLQSDERKRKRKSNEQEAACPEVGVRDSPPAALPFSGFCYAAKVFDSEQDDEGLGGGGGNDPPASEPHFGQGAEAFLRLHEHLQEEPDSKADV